MSARDPLIMLLSDVADDIGAASEPGSLVARVDTSENLAYVTGFRADSGAGSVDWRHGAVPSHYTSVHDAGTIGRCHAADRELHMYGYMAFTRRQALTWEGFRGHLRGRSSTPGTQPVPYVTYVPESEELPEQVPRWMGWWVTRDGVDSCDLTWMHSDADPLAFLEPEWPVDRLRDRRVAVIGVGSIGSAAAKALGDYGVGHIDLIDPDRLLQHNIIRHAATAHMIGRWKVNAVADLLQERLPYLDVTPHIVDVVTDADTVRLLFGEADVVLAAPDGVAPRLAVNRMARWARRSAVFAAVLEDGVAGEILVAAPGRGCLLCHRRHLQDEGGFDPEPGIDQGYGTGTAHRPMTAVGPDLTLVGTLAAKAAIAIMLERSGMREQRLEGNHGTIGLRPQPDLTPPFNLTGPGAVKWTTFSPYQGCPTCNLT